jgi:hypothetical protein
MLKHRWFAACLVLVLWPANLPALEGTAISQNQIHNYLKNGFERFAQEDSRNWEDRMYRALAKKHDVDDAARALALEDLISPSDEKALISLWLAHSATLRSDERARTQQKIDSDRRAIQQKAIDTVRASDHSPFVVRIAVRVITAEAPCDVEVLDKLLAGASDRLATGFAAAAAAKCAPWWLALHSRYPENRAIRAELSRRDREFNLAERLELLETLNFPAQAEPESRVSLMLDYVSALWRAGLFSDGLAIVDAASDADRPWLFNDHPLPEYMTLDGISVTAGHSDRGHMFFDRHDDFRLEYTAALYLTGRVDEARSSFERLPYTALVRSFLDCLAPGVQSDRKSDDDPCSRKNFDLFGNWWLLDSIFNRPDEDPYPVVEAALGEGLGASISLNVDSALWLETLRRRLDGENYRQLRERLAENWVRRNLAPHDPQTSAALSGFMSDSFRQKSSGYELRIREGIEPWKVPRGSENVERERITARPPQLPAGFRELPVPESLRSGVRSQERVGKWPAGMAPLPDGYLPVRVERGVPFTVAVSLSQNLDPVGEVSSGGYWIHLSRNGGVSWEEPLYTGLPEYFPYVALPSSKLPILSGDRITLEVVVQEIDPSTISYPPVSLKSLRRASGLYIEMPLAALTSDRDHDGLTDIVEAHLLLNPDNPDSDGDGIDDGRDMLPNVKNSSPATDNSYLAQILEQISGRSEGAIIEPVDRDPNSVVDYIDRAGEPQSMNRPLFVQGQPEDFAGLRTGSRVLVYSDADIERLRAQSPDFHALTLRPVVFNRAHDRGFVSWSMGWTGGTLRLIRERNTYRIEVIIHWIT